LLCLPASLAAAFLECRQELMVQVELQSRS